MHKTDKQAFTLIEMLIVITIIVVLSAGITMIQPGGTSQKVYTAQRNLMTAFFEARNAAVSKQTNARVIIYRGSDPDLKLRRFGVIYETENGWVALNQGGTLPEGTFFSPPDAEFHDIASVDKASGFTESEVYKSTFNNGKTGAERIVGINFPSTDAQELDLASGEWYSYLYTSDGLSANPGAYVMICTGNITGKDKLLINNPHNQVGFAVRKFGNTIAFSDYTEIEEIMSK